MCACTHAPTRVTELTVEFAAHQLHAQGAGFATHDGNDADVLGDDWGVKQVGLDAVVVHVSNKYLLKKEKVLQVHLIWSAGINL